MTPDPVNAALDSLRAVTSQEAFEDLLFPDCVFQGMRNKDEVYQTILGNLEETAWSDTRTHRQTSVQEDVDPKPSTP